MKILLTTTSFQDTPGNHHRILDASKLVVDTIRGPVKEDVLLPIIDQYDGVICGDDEFSRDVLEKGKNGNLKVISKYGVGLDKIDLEATRNLGIKVYNTPGVNHITVAEHTLSLMLAYLKNIHLEYNITKEGGWTRLIGTEVYGKRIGVLGLGKIGKELVKRLVAFGVKIFVYDKEYDDTFLTKISVEKVSSVDELIKKVDIVSLHLPLVPETYQIISKDIIKQITKPIVIVNTSRGLLIDQEALYSGLISGKIKAYLTDVMDEEPMKQDNALKDLKNVLITPHIGSRTFESVERQGMMAVENILSYFSSNH